ncbi:MAG: hypothetical protein GX605_04015 [Chloroflexi bacterium]|nr:hypothetical protein [Chloroflexota bacterium]
MHTLFYLALTVTMGVWSQARSTVLGMSMGVQALGLLTTNLLGSLAFWLPWGLPMAGPAVAQGMALPALPLLPVAATALLTLPLVAAALWRFHRLEL